MTLSKLPVLCCAALISASSYAANIPSVYLEKLKDTPDLMQSLPEAKLPGQGAAYCAPVAVSNSIVWLQRHGLKTITDDQEWNPRTQGALALLLSSPKYMHTTEDEGTGARGIMTGLSLYLKERHLGPFKIQYEGWDRHPKQFSTGIIRPSLDWIKESILGKSAVWLKIGWYHYSAKNDRYKRFAGHWVTLVGYGEDEQGRPNPNILIIHDPAPRSGPVLSHDRVLVQTLNHGTLCDSDGHAAIAARGFYRLGGGLKIKDGADAGILDLAIALGFE